MVVHQLLPRFASGDAATRIALQFQIALRRIGAWGEIYAAEVDQRLAALARPADALRPSADEWVLYHLAEASPLAGALAHLRCRRGLVFHGVAPGRVYAATARVEPLTSARAQLAALAPHVNVAIGLSALTVKELRLAGAEEPRLVTPFVEPARFSADNADRAMLNQLQGSGPTLLSVGNGQRHERLQDVLALHAELRRLEPDARLLVCGSREGTLLRRARSTGGVQFLPPLSHAQRVAAYRSATAFVSMSEYDGFGEGLLDAMAADLPVIAFAATSVPDTLGGAGIAFTEKRPAFLAELVRELHRNASLRQSIVDGQRVRLQDFSSATTQKALAEALGAPAGRKRASRRAKSAKARVAVIVQRYGEGSGGAEAHARALAQRLAPLWDITVLTTCAKDHLTWANDLPPGKSSDGPVQVMRFPCEDTRRMPRFNALSRTVLGRSNDRLAEERWIAEQGPRVPELLRHLAEEKSRYDGYIAFTYLYAPTAWGLPLVADRALVVPTAHDEPAIGMDAFADVFERPRAILCNTPEEEALIHKRFPACARTRVTGVGIDAVRGDAGRFRKRFEVERPYLLYVGRIEPGKDIPELLRFHEAMGADAPDLLLAGALGMEVAGPGVKYLGRLSEEDKFDAIAGAQAVVVPSRHESLSLLALEAFSQGTPVVANGRSDVLAGQSRRSGAGVTYSDARSFDSAVEQARSQRAALGKQGKAFARKHRWSDVIQVYREEMTRIMEAK